MSPSLTVKKLKPDDFAPLSLKPEVFHFSVCVFYSSTLSRLFLPSEPPKTVWKKVIVKKNKTKTDLYWKMKIFHVL